MKKVIRLTESDLVRIVKRIIKEEESCKEEIDELLNEYMYILETIISAYGSIPNDWEGRKEVIQHTTNNRIRQFRNDLKTLVNDCGGNSKNYALDALHTFDRKIDDFLSSIQ